jgi:hypothetical protein
LELRGVRVDCVDEVSGERYVVADDEPLSSETIQEVVGQWKGLLDSWREGHTDCATYPTGVEWESAFGRTLVGDFLMSEFPIRRVGVEHESRIGRLFEDGLKDEEEYWPLWNSLSGMVPNQVFFVSRMGYVGIGPLGMRKGDEVWVLGGGAVPFVLRSSKDTGLGGRAGGDGERSRHGEEDGAGNQSQHEFVGDAYVHGIMDGQAAGEEVKMRSVWLR